MIDLLRNKNPFCVLLSIVLGIPFLCQSQVSYPGMPIGLKYDHGKNVSYIQLEDASVLQTEKEMTVENQGLKLDEYATVINVDVTPLKQGTWDYLDNNQAIWRIGFTSPNASSLGITLSPYSINPGCKIVIYSPDGKQVLGAFTFRNRNSSGVLTISEINGDSMIVELQTSSTVKDYGVFKVATIGVGYPHGINYQTEKDGYYGWSADCHVDINCIKNPEVQHQKYSTCRLVIERPSGRLRCSGTLLNNTSLDGTPYILTAGHCISDEYSANRTIVYFDYESPYCNGPDGQLKSISGATLRSRADNLDFTLLELNEKPPIDFSPVYSGWDATGNSFDTCYSIHHPEGDVKKYCDNISDVQYGSFSSFDPGTFWLIPKYYTGTTENGSSGAPLFNISNRVVGTLTGGGVECTEYINDYYQKLSDSWFDYMSVDKQLKSWLDPENTGALVLDNLEPYLGVTEQLSNITSNDTLESIHLTNGWGYISGHNSINSSQFAEHYYRNGSKYIHSLYLKVAKAVSQNSDSRIVLKIWEGENQPEYELYSQDLYNFELLPNELNFIRLDSLIFVNQHFFVGYEIYYTQPIDTFATFVAIFNNIDSTNSAYTLINDKWQRLTDGNQLFNASLAIYPLVLDYFPPPDNQYGIYPFEDIIIYPNPSSGDFQLLFKNKIDGEVRLTVYDLAGNKILEESFLSPEPNIRFSSTNLKEGIFLLKIEYDGRVNTMKFIKQK